MKVGNIVNGLAVVDVKRVNKMNLIQFTKAVSEYIELGYKLDVHSSRQVGLVLQVDLYKLESNLSGSVGSTGEDSPVEDSPTEDVVKEPNETKEEFTEDETEYPLSSESNKERLLESVERIKAKVNNGAVGDSITDDTKALLPESKVVESVLTEEVEVEQNTTPPVKKTRAKKTT